MCDKNLVPPSVTRVTFPNVRVCFLSKGVCEEVLFQRLPVQKTKKCVTELRTGTVYCSGDSNKFKCLV